MSDNFSTLNNIFCTFQFSTEEYALNVKDVQEVVNYPAKVNPMPLAPEYLVGIFNLRDMIIPLIDLYLLLNVKRNEDRSFSKVAIVDCNGAKIGILFDRTGEILRISGNEKCDFSYNDPKQCQVVEGVLRLENDRIIQLIGVNKILQIENIPMVVEHQRKMLEAKAKFSRSTNRKKCISFNVGEVNFAIDMDGIHEIVKINQIQNSAMSSDICKGYIHLRKNIIPIIDTKFLLFGVKSPENYDTQRLIVFKLEKEYFGLLVESVNSIDTYGVDELMPIPLLSKNRTNMFRGCVKSPDEKDLILLEQTKILENEEVLSITHGHSKLYQETTQEDTKKNNLNREVYITFRSQHLFGFQIKEIQEIIHYSDDLLKAPGLPGFVVGMLNLRGKLVSIINLRDLYGFQLLESKEFKQSKIIILKIAEELIGLVVDNVDSIMTVDMSKKMKLPELLFNQTSKNFQKDIKEVIQIEGQGETSRALIILEKTNLATRIQNMISQVATMENVEVLKQESLD